MTKLLKHEKMGKRQWIEVFDIENQNTKKNINERMVKMKEL